MLFLRSRLLAPASGLIAFVLAWTSSAAFSTQCVECQTAAGDAGSPVAQLETGMPLTFTANRGQWADGTLFTARSGGISAEFAERGWTLRLLDARETTAPCATAVTLTFESPALTSALDAAPRLEAAHAGSLAPACVPASRLAGVGAPTGRVNIHHGAQPERWLRDIPNYAALRYSGLYAGIDLVVRDVGPGRAATSGVATLTAAGRIDAVGRAAGAACGRFEYDLLLDPGASLRDVRVRVDGARSLRVDGDGALVIATDGGVLRHDLPATWQLAPDGTREALTARCVVLDAQHFGFEVPGRDPARALVLDPGLTYSSYLGGSNWDHVTAIARGPGQTVFVAGYTTSANFPTSAGGQQRSLAGYGDAFIAQLELSTSTLLWSTYLGGDDGVIFVNESATALAVDAAGAVYVAGIANSLDFPTTQGAFRSTAAGGIDGFAAKLDGNGALLWSTYLGGAKDDRATGLALAADGVVVTGHTFSDGAGGGLAFPTTAGAFDTSYNSIFFTNDAFVSKLLPDGSALSWSTLLGGVLRDEATAVAVDTAGAVIVTGLTGSNNFPTSAGALDTSFNGATANELDAFVSKLASNGSALSWSTYVGGAESDEARAVALGADGAVNVAGVTRSAAFPTTPGAFRTTFAGGASDAFATRLAADGSALVWSSLLGGSGDDAAAGIALDAANAVTVAGGSTSSDFPVSAGASGQTNAGGEDAFIARLDAAGAKLLHGSTYGGAADEQAFALALDVHGAALFAGETASTNLPLSAGAFDASSNGGGDAFVARMDLPPWTNLGQGKPGTAGKTPLLVGTGSLVIGSAGALTLSDARPSSLLFLFVGFAAGNAPFKGGTLVPFPPLLTLQLITLPNGGFPLVFPAWPSGLPVGFSLYFQEWIADPVATNGAAASNALQATQP